MLAVDWKGDLQRDGERVGANAARRRSGRSGYVGRVYLLMLQRKFPDALGF